MGWGCWGGSGRTERRGGVDLMIVVVVVVLVVAVVVGCMRWGWAEWGDVELIVVVGVVVLAVAVVVWRLGVTWLGQEELGLDWIVWDRVGRGCKVSMRTCGCLLGAGGCGGDSSSGGWKVCGRVRDGSWDGDVHGCAGFAPPHRYPTQACIRCVTRMALASRFSLLCTRPAETAVRGRMRYYRIAPCYAPTPLLLPSSVS